MRNYSIPINDMLRRGIRNDKRNTNGEALESLTGLIPTEHGLASPYSVSRPLTPTVSWPFPQLIKMSGITLLADETSLSSVTESSWATAAITTYDPATPANTKAISAGGPWHCADFNKAWFLFNGASVVFKTNRDGYAGSAEKVYTQNAITVNTGAAFKGRLFMAGFDSNELFNSDWQTAWSALENVTDIGFEPGWENNTNWYWYSSPGGGNMIWPFVYTLGRDGQATNTDYGASRPFYLEWAYRLDSGFGPLPWAGTVYAALPLGDHLILYGDYGIAALYPVQIPGPDGLAANVMGIRHLARYGVASRGAVAGDDTGHVFMDIGGRLRSITPDLKITDLDYREFFEDFLGDEVVITYQPHLEEYRISDGTTGYLLNRHGLAIVTPNATSNVFAQGGNVVISSAAAGTSINLLTPIINMNSEAQKTIFQVALRLQNITSPQVRVHYRYSRNSSFSTTGWADCNTEGYAFPKIAGVDFKIEVQGTDAGDAKLDGIEVTYQVTDKRFQKGVQIVA